MSTQSQDPQSPDPQSPDPQSQDPQTQRPRTSTKTAQRRARQERARAAREAERRAARRRKNLVVGGVVAAVIAVLVGIGVIVGVTSSGSDNRAVVAPRGAVMDGPAIARGATVVGNADAPVTVDLYEDFNCPVCGQFEKADGEALNALVKDGTAKIRYHMLSFIDDKNGGTYSHRAANAFAAAFQYGTPEQAQALHAALYANQPDESSAAGLSNERILELARSVGLTSPQFAAAVNNDEFGPWVKEVADLGSKAGVNGTPTIFVNERQVELKSLINQAGQLDPNILTQQVRAAAG